MFTVRSYLAQHSLRDERKRPLYVVAEILDAENVDHARSAGADEVIETTRLGFSLLAHTIEQPGTAALLSRVGVKGVQNIYVGAIPETITLPKSFGQLASAVKAETGALVIGVRTPAANDILNPADDIQVVSTSQVIYLADRAILDTTESEARGA